MANSVNTNVGAMVALQSLEYTQSQLSVTQKQISTGSRVADSTDDGAAYAIAQTIRSSTGGLTSANQQLGNVQGLLSTTQAGLNSVSNMMNSMRDVLVKLGDSSIQGADRTNYQTQYSSMLANVKTFISDATYNGKSLIGDIAPTTSGYATLHVARDGIGSSYCIAGLGASTSYASIGALTNSGTVGTAVTSTTAAAALTAKGVFVHQQGNIGASLNAIGNNINFVSHQISYNSGKIDALNSGLGSLVDADLAKESAMLTALQIRQQLGTQALSLANQAPQTLLSLFK